MSKSNPDFSGPVNTLAHPPPSSNLPIAHAVPVGLSGNNNNLIPIGRNTFNQAQLILRNALPFTNPVIPLEDGVVMTEREHALLEGPYKLSRRIR